MVGTRNYSISQFILLCSISLLCACKNQTIDPSESNCTTATEFKKEVKDIEGLFYYQSSLRSYAISYHHPNTYDLVDIGIICNMPKDFDIPEDENNTQKVIFSGIYWQYDKPIQNAPAGSKYYYLEVTEIEKLN